MKIEDFMFIIQREHYKAEAIAKKFAPGYRFITSYEDNFLAFMSHDKKVVTLSIVRAAMIVAEVMSTYSKTKKFGPQVTKMIKEHNIEKDEYAIISFLCFYIILGVYLHEIAHIMYTPVHSRYSDMMNDMQVTVPEKFVAFIANLVEDAYIQRRFLYDFKFKKAQYAMRIVEEIVQGPQAVNRLNEQQNADIKQLLFYLVLTRYNRGIKTPLPKEIVAEFLSIYFVESTDHRIQLTIEFAQKLFDFLKEFQQDKHIEEQQQQKQQQQQQEAQSNQATLGDTEMTPPSEGRQESDQDGEGQEAPGLTDNDNLMDNKEEKDETEQTREETTKDGTEEQEENSSSSDAENDDGVGESEEVDESTGEEGDSDESGMDDSDSDAESESIADQSDTTNNGDAGNDGDNDDGFDESSSDNDDGESGSGDEGQSSDDSTDDGESNNTDPEDSNQPGDSDDGETEDSSGESTQGGAGSDEIEELTDEELEEIIGSIIDDILEEEAIQHEGESKGDVVDNITDKEASAMADVGENEYKPESRSKLNLPESIEETTKAFVTAFKRIQSYTFNSRSYGRKGGKFDKKVAHKTAMTNRVFYKTYEPKRDMDLFTLILLDASGSMDMRQMPDSSLKLNQHFEAITVGLMYALEVVKAKTELLCFSDATIKAKGINQRVIKESLYYHLRFLNEAYLDSGTQILKSIEYADNIFRGKGFKDKLLIIFTDGGYAESRNVLRPYTQSLKKQGVHVVLIGIDLPNYVLDNYRDTFPDANVRNYSGAEDLHNRLPRDLTTYLTNKFMKNKNY